MSNPTLQCRPTVSFLSFVFGSVQNGKFDPYGCNWILSFTFPCEKLLGMLRPSNRKKGAGLP